MTTLSTHVLDAVTGRPAGGVAVQLRRADGAVLAEGVTDGDGRIRPLGGELAPGVHELVFATGEWFAARGQATFYPQVSVAFTVADGDTHLHVPVLLSQFAYSTYRGS